MAGTVSPLRKNDTVTLCVEGYTAEGLGLARYEGQVVFVHRGIRGEKALCRIEKVGKSLAYARVVSAEEPSPHRVEPDCPYYGKCGGCDYRHMDYEEELYAKREKVQTALKRLGGCEVEVEPVSAAAETERYRNKVQFPVSPDGKVGFYRARTHEVTDIRTCRLQTEAAERAAEALRCYREKYAVSGYDEVRHSGLLRHLFVRTDREGRSLICVVANAETLPHEEELVRMMRENCPQAVGVLLCTNREKTNVVLGERYRTLWGEDSLRDSLSGFCFRLSVPSFFQVNREQAEVLYEKAVSFADLTGRETVLDLYCGVGTVTSVLARHCARVIGAEVVPEAVEDAWENARQNGIRNAEFFCGDAGEVAAKLAAEGLRPDVVTVDPPRKGLAPEVVEEIASMAPQRVVYISCDPATLGRDVGRFRAAGYECTRAAAVDMFPRTSHVETVVLLSKLCPEERKVEITP